MVARIIHTTLTVLFAGLLLIVLPIAAAASGGPFTFSRWETRDDVPTGPVIFSHNRVEGSFLGLRLDHTNQQHYGIASGRIYGHIGRGIESRTWRYQAGLERHFSYGPRLILGAEVHDLTDTQDTWILPTHENTLAALLIHEDYHDFYRRAGYSAYLRGEVTRGLGLIAGVRVDQYGDMPTQDVWSIFGRGKTFRRNPGVATGKLRSGMIGAELDTRRDRDYPYRSGWYLMASAEFAGDHFQWGRNIKSDYSFDRYVLDLRRFQVLGRGESLAVRVRAASARGDLPVQFRYDLGGLSTLRAHRYKSFENGDRMLLANVEYWVSGRHWDIDLLDDFNLVFFVDSGMLWNAQAPDNPVSDFYNVTYDDLRTDAGVGIATYDSGFRVNFARRTDTGDSPWVITVRIAQPF